MAWAAVLGLVDLVDQVDAALPKPRAPGWIPNANAEHPHDTAAREETR